MSKEIHFCVIFFAKQSVLSMIVRISCSTRTRQASQRCSNVRVVFDPFGMTDANNFSNPSKFNRSIRLIEDELNHTKEDFINHFKETYTNQYPPSWMLTEILSFGVITNVYSNIKNKKIKKRITNNLASPTFFVNLV